MDIPHCFYRISIKALVLNESRDKFLIVQEEDGEWELPGGGLDWGMSPQEDLPREIDEEMGVPVTWVAEHPSYFFTLQTRRYKQWIANVLYEAKLAHLDIIPSDECVAVQFVSPEEIQHLPAAPNVHLLAKLFDAKRHVQ